jgi:P27 family predicted phage terminase small subunit
MRGRKPKPTALRLIEGNASKRPLNAREPKPSVKVPTCPAHLNPSAKAEWKRIARQMFTLGMISDLGRAVLAAYGQPNGGFAEAEKKLSETPSLIKLPSGYIQPSPWLTIASKQPELMIRYMSELRLSPVSRSRVSVITPPQPKPWEFGAPTGSKFDGLLGREKDEFFGWAEQ